jgi:DNA-binding transcriptional LysR family regulator
MKTYVECGLGIAIVASRAFDKAKDGTLRAIPIDHLIAPTPVNVCLRRGSHVRSYVYDFIELVCPRIAREEVVEALQR